MDEIKDAITEEQELVLYRDSTKGLIKLTIYEDDLVAYSFIGKNKKDDFIRFYENSEQKIDFEQLAYNILCK